MFKLSLITDEVSQNLREAADFALRNGISGLELRSINGRGPFAWTQEDIGEVDRVLRETGLVVSCLALPFFKCSMDKDEEVAEHIEGLKSAMKLAERWNVKLLRGFTFWKDSGSWEGALEKYRAILQLLEGTEYTLVLETEPSVYTANASLLAKFLKELDSPRVKALWDPGNLPFDEDGEQPYPDGYALLRGQIAHMHLKDAVGCGDDAKAVCLGTGLVDFPGQIKALREDGYDGFMSLETHYRLEVQLTEEQLKLPGGAAFSQGGMAASQECMDALKKWL